MIITVTLVKIPKFFRRPIRLYQGPYRLISKQYCLHTWWESPPLCPAYPSNTGCRKNASGEQQESEAVTTSQTFWSPVDVSYMLDNTCVKLQTKEESDARWKKQQWRERHWTKIWQRKPYHGSCSPSVSMVVKSSVHSFRATVAFFFWGCSMLSCFS